MINAALREWDRQRAGGACEYCRLPESALPLTFHVEHVQARQHGGPDDAENLGLACDRCNLYKGPNLVSIDPQTGEPTPLFHPRRDQWDQHFRLEGDHIIGVTPTGRTTARLLQFNAPRRVRLRSMLRKLSP